MVTPVKTLMAVLSASILSLGVGATAASGTETSPLTIVASADTGIMAAGPGRVGGSETVIRTQGLPESKAKEALVRFTVPSSAGTWFDGATLRLYYTYPHQAPGGFTQVRAVSNDWSEAQTTWRNRPAAGPVLGQVANPAQSGVFLSVDVSSFVSQPGTYSFYLWSTGDETAFFSSREGTHPPQLILTPSVGEPAVPHGSVTSGFSGAGVGLATVRLYAAQNQQHSGPVGFAVSNAAGGYRVQTEAPTGDYTLIAEANGYTDGSAAVTLTDAPISATDIALEPVMQQITGSVDTSRGDPIADATVSLFAASDTARTDPLVVTQTDADGTFRFQAPRGDYDLTATADGYLDKETTVTVDDAAVSGADVWLESPQSTATPYVVDTDRGTPLSMRFGYNDNMTRTTRTFTDPAFESAVRDSGATTLRFPGGTISDLYDWAADDFITPDPPEGCNPPASALSATAQSNADRGQYGYSGFQQMVSDTGIRQVLYVANLSTAPQGKDPVDYFLAAMAAKKAAGLDLDVIELGNEVYGQPKGCLNGLIDPTHYMDEAKRAATGLRALFPGVKIVIDEAFRGDRSPEAAAPRDEWNRAIAAYPDQSFYDGISVHNYSGFGPTTTLQQSKDRVFATGQRLTSSAFSYLHSLFPGKSIWMTEGGLFLNHDPRGQTMLDAMAETDYAMRWADDPRVKDYIKHSFLHGPNSSFPVVTELPDGSLLKNATYYALGIYGKALAKSSERLDSSVRHGDGYVWTEKDGTQTFVPYLTLRSYLSSDGDTLYVPFVSKSQVKRTVRVILTGDRVTAPGEATMTSVSGPLLARNSANDPDRIVPATGTISIGARQRHVIEVTIPAQSVGAVAIPLKGR